MRICYYGGFWDPQAYFLLEMVLTELHVADLQEVSREVNLWLSTHRALVFRAEQDTPTLTRWRLTEWGELLLRELIDVVLDSRPAAYRRERVRQALRLAEGRPW